MIFSMTPRCQLRDSGAEEEVGVVEGDEEPAPEDDGATVGVVDGTVGGTVSDGGAPPLGDDAEAEAEEEEEDEAEGRWGTMDASASPWPGVHVGTCSESGTERMSCTLKAVTNCERGDRMVRA